MRIEGKLSYAWLLVPILLFAGAQMFALAGADNSTAAAGPASHNVTKAHADVVVISDWALLTKSIAGFAGCSSSSRSVAASSIGKGCPVVDCAAPPPGCFYQGPPATGPNGCPINCGTLVCGPDAL